jgi:hypothetical protein
LDLTFAVARIVFRKEFTLKELLGYSIYLKASNNIEATSPPTTRQLYNSNLNLNKSNAYK